MGNGQKRSLPEGDKLSDRQRKLHKVRNPGADDKERGDIRYDEYGSLEWFDHREQRWIKVVYHNDIRAHLLARASNNGTRQYSSPRARGELPFDETAFHLEQQDWTSERAHWGRVRNDVLNRLEKRDWVGRYDKDPVLDWYEGECIVLDHDNHPVRVFPDLPLTLSSALEDYIIEAVMRLDARIQRRDIRARMPRFRKNKQNKIVPMYGLAAIGNKSLRFREAQGLIAWETRKSSEAVNGFMKRRLPAEAVAQNTSIGGTPLTREELKTLRELKKKGGESSRDGEENSEEDDSPQHLREKSKEKGKSGRRNVENPVTSTHLTRFDPFSDSNTGWNPVLQRSQEKSAQDSVDGLDNMGLPFDFGSFGNPFYDLSADPFAEPFRDPFGDPSGSHQAAGQMPTAGYYGLDNNNVSNHYQRPNHPENQHMPEHQTVIKDHGTMNGTNNANDSNIGHSNGNAFQRDKDQDWFDLDQAHFDGNPLSESQIEEILQRAIAEPSVPVVPNKSIATETDCNQKLLSDNMGQFRPLVAPHDANSTNSAPSKKRKHNQSFDQSGQPSQPAAKRQRSGAHYLEEFSGQSAPFNTNSQGDPLAPRLDQGRVMHQDRIDGQAVEQDRHHGPRLQPYQYVPPTMETQDSDKAPEATHVADAIAEGGQQSSQKQDGAANGNPTRRANSSGASSDTILQSYHNVTPETPAQVRTIQNVLEYARQDFVGHLRGAWFTINLPITDPNTSYQEQYDQVYVAFIEQWWQAHSIEEMPPQLRTVTKWSGTWEDWELEPLQLG